MYKDNSVKECPFCGERSSCTAHRNKEGRKKSIEEQLALEKERGTKTAFIFNGPREKVLAAHGLKDW